MLQDEVKKAIEVMKAGGVILYPTDTVWGIGCDATNEEAVKKVFAIKKREDSKALICLVDSDVRLQRYVRNVADVTWDMIELSEKPLTVIFDNVTGLAPNVIAEDGSAGIRITREEFSKELCFRFQKPIVSTSLSTRQMSALLSSLFLMANTFFTASSLVASHPMPQTVSVG